ncbi:pentapeptide repeat-containing protein [uncultured Tateyamaria sp.]|uniref:pentapeptide repeat-containing protein n=1 Tax=uncultured Tateyamaria sp. TaxID=455651 RepID=UPI002609CAB3|nr:pentapeptide repeat-containing protein [uncultured Tateyamaria sp.]
MKSVTVLARVLGALTPVLIGVAIGIVLALGFLFRAEWLLEGSVWVGFAGATFALFLFAVFRSLTRSFSDLRGNSESKSDQDIFESLLGEILPNSSQLSGSRDEILTRVRAISKTVMSFWGATIAIGFCFTAIGAVIATITALAAIRQVDRLDKQNELIDLQISIAKSARSSAVFAAQMPSLMDEMYRERAEQSLWTPSQSLQARIQALIYSLEPYQVDNQVAEIIGQMQLSVEKSELGEMVPGDLETLAGQDLSNSTYSPERGQLLQLLISAGVNFDELSVPFQIPDADLSSLKLVGSIDLYQQELRSLGKTVLTGANLRGTDFVGIDATGVDFSGSVFSSIDLLATVSSPWFSADHATFERTGGPTLGNIVVISDDTDANHIMNGLHRTWVNWSDEDYRITVQLLPVADDVNFNSWIHPYDDGTSTLSFLFWEKILAFKISTGQSVYLFGDKNFYPTPFDVAYRYKQEATQSEGGCAETSWAYWYLRDRVQTGQPLLAPNGEHILTGTRFPLSNQQIECLNSDFERTGSATTNYQWVRKYDEFEVERPAPDGFWE